MKATVAAVRTLNALAAIQADLVLIKERLGITEPELTPIPEVEVETGEPEADLEE